MKYNLLVVIYGSKENKDNSIYLPNIIQNLKIFLQNPVSQFSSFLLGKVIVIKATIQQLEAE